MRGVHRTHLPLVTRGKDDANRRRSEKGDNKHIKAKVACLHSVRSLHGLVAVTVLFLFIILYCCRCRQDAARLPCVVGLAR